MCNIKVCPKCYEILFKKDKCLDEILENTEHVCNEDTVKTIELMRKECKSCPKCSTLISKISGCNMMWCTQCKTAFCWKTGQIETGNIHNPHYWEYLRMNNQDINMVRNLYNINNLNQRQHCGHEWQELYRISKQKYIYSLIRDINHIEYVELSMFRVDDLALRNEDLRGLYLKGEIDEGKFKFEIHKRNKRNNYNIEMRQILEMLINVIKDTVIRREQENIETRKDVYKSLQLNIDIYKEINNIINYAKENAEKICKRYDYVLPRLIIFDPNQFYYIR
jgi:hypothetical protein